MFRVQHYIAWDGGNRIIWPCVEYISCSVDFANVDPLKFVAWVHANTPIVCTFEGGRRFTLRMNFDGVIIRDETDAILAFERACSVIESNGVEVQWDGPDDGDNDGKYQLFVMN